MTTARIDHHVHTSRHSPDSVIEPLELLEAAREAGLTGVVITDHDHQWDPEEVAELASRAPDLVVLSGAEISAREGHFLVYGLPNLANVPVGVSLAGLIVEAKAHGAAVVAAHPYRWGQDFDAIATDHRDGLDAAELVSNNVTIETRGQLETLLARLPMATTGSSDGHEPGVVGCYHTAFPTAIRTMAEFVAAIKSGRGRPGHRIGGRQACGPAARS